jgi:hypothetical protein
MPRTSKSSSYKKNSFSKLKQQKLVMKQLKWNTKNNNNVSIYTYLVLYHHESYRSHYYNS